MLLLLRRVQISFPCLVHEGVAKVLRRWIKVEVFFWVEGAIQQPSTFFPEFVLVQCKFVHKCSCRMEQQF